MIVRFVFCDRGFVIRLGPLSLVLRLADDDDGRIRLGENETFEIGPRCRLVVYR